MALPVGFKAIVTRLDAGTLTELMSRLLQAEAERLGMPADAVVVSDALTDADGGLDARIDDAPADSQHIPPGLSGFQFKASKTKAVSRLKLDEELAKPGPRRVLENGGTYVLVWQADLNDMQRTGAETALDTEARRIADDPRCRIWDASAIVALAEGHPAVVEALELVEFEAVRGLDELRAALRIEDRPYEADDARAAAIEQIRNRATEQTEDPTVVTVTGLAGTGKTRLVVEALDIDGLRDSVVYAGSAQGLQTFVARIVRDERTSGILVVDELDESDRRDIYTRLAATRGRWRLLPILPQSTSRYRASGARDVVLPPLAGDATRRLIETTSGLPEARARVVAEVAQGFPELAFRLAEELLADPNLDLLTLAHLERQNELLQRALPDPELRAALKPLSLFTGLGVEGDLAYQLESVAEAFGKDVAALRQTVEIELSRHRFVSAAGRYRSVSPTLVAIWLATELIDETPELDQVIAALPEPVQDAFYAQLELLGPQARQLGPALERLLEDDRFRDPGPFDEAAGRFLRAAAAVIPAQVAASIDSILAAASQDQLRSLPRRDLVWALEILRWWPESWETAVRNLHRLALTETETWANNATGTFKESFTVYLSGSTVPFADRIRWLERTLAAASDGELDLLADAAAMGLERHHTRTVVGFRGGGEPQDWQPATVGELRAARESAWGLLLRIIDRLPGDARFSHVQRLSRAVITMAEEGLIERASNDIRGREWTRTERAEFLGDLNRLARYGQLPDDLIAALRELARSLEGEVLEERLAVTLATPVWELYGEGDDYNEPPSVLRELAKEVAMIDGGVQLALQVGSDIADSNTRFQFLRLMAAEVGARAIFDVASRDPLDEAAFAAALSVGDGQGAGDAVDEALALIRETSPATLPNLVTYAAVRADRVAAVLDLVADGVADVRPLANLRGGGRALELPAEVADRLVTALADNGDFEAALGITHQLVEAAGGEAEDRVRERAWPLVRAAIQSENEDTMIEYYVKELVGSDLFEGDDLVELWRLRMRHRRGLVEELDDVLTERGFRHAPEAMLDEVIELIRDEASGKASFSLFVSRDLALLSRAAAVLGVDRVWEAVDPLNEHEFRIAVHYMQWGGGAPDPLVARFLSSSRLAGYETEAMTTFFNTLGTVSGDFWRALEREKARAEAWREALQDEQAKRWATELVGRYEHDIEWQRAREEEEDFRLGR